MKKYLIFALCIFSFVFINVNASVLSKENFGFTINNSSDLAFDFCIGNGSSKSYTLSLFIDGYDYTKYNYLILDVCTTGYPGIEVTGTCNESCFTRGELIYYNTHKKCKVSNYNGTILRFQGGIDKFYDYTGAGEYKVASQFKFSNNIGYTTFAGINDLYLSDEDILTSLIAQDKQQNSLDNINSNLNDLESKQDQTNQKLDEQNKIQQEQNDFLMDDTAPDVDIGNLGTVSGLLPAGPIDSLLNIPFKFLSVLTSSLSGTCSPLSGTFVFDSTITIPCFNDVFYKEVPDYLMNFISLIPAGFILIKYFKHLYKKVERATSLETTSDDEWGAI